MAPGTRRSKPSDPTEVAARLAALAVALGEHLDVDVAQMGLRLGRSADSAHGAGDARPVLPDDAGPAHLAAAFESSLGPGARRLGAHHTPHDVAEGLVALAVGDQAMPATVCDPSVGGGAFLVGAAERLVAGGLTREEAVARLWGVDVDPLAIAVTEAVLALWCGVDPQLADRLVVGDFLLDGATAWARPPPSGFDLVIGNPPFQSQLAGRTARSRAEAARLRERFGAVAAGYADTAGVFLVAAAEAMADSGTTGLIVPESLLSARDAGPVRARITDLGRLRAVWRPPARVFDADVDVVALVVDAVGPDVASTPPRPVAVHRQADGEDQPVPVTLTAPDAWAPLMAADEAVPGAPLLVDGGTLGGVASTTAGFRQHFYALAEVVRERGPSAPDGARLVTAGGIDPAFDRWGTWACRIGGRSWTRPEIEVGDIADPAVQRWVTARRVAKVLVATQTRVIEAMVDLEGDAVPVTPVVSVEPTVPTDAGLWRLLAVLSAPPVSAWAHRAVAGSGLGRGTIRVSARLISAVPLPVDGAAWQEGADQARVAQQGSPDGEGRVAALWAMGAAMTAAYGQPQAVTDWWWERLPRR